MARGARVFALLALLCLSLGVCRAMQAQDRLAESGEGVRFVRAGEIESAVRSAVSGARDSIPARISAALRDRASALSRGERWTVRRSRPACEAHNDLMMLLTRARAEEAIENARLRELRAGQAAERADAEEQYAAEQREAASTGRSVEVIKAYQRALLEDAPDSSSPSPSDSSSSSPDTSSSVSTASSASTTAPITSEAFVHWSPPVVPAPPSPPASSPAPSTTTYSVPDTSWVEDATYWDSSSPFKSALKASFFFYQAQISGSKPSWSEVSWRGDAHLSDPIVGGFYDAGDTLKLTFPLASALTNLAWSLRTFGSGYDGAGAREALLQVVEWGADYLVACHVADRQLVGQIGDPSIDHAYWGRPEDESNERPAFVWDEETPATDLIAATAAALAAASTVVTSTDDDGSSKPATYLAHAKTLFDWATDSSVTKGLYSNVFMSKTYIYPSSSYEDDQAYAAAWLAAATGDSSYLETTASIFNSQYFYGISVYASWDSNWASAASLALELQNVHGFDVPSADVYESFISTVFVPAWVQAAAWGITYTDAGLAYINGFPWGALRYTMNAAFLVAVRANYEPDSSTKDSLTSFVENQVNYALGSSGRSYVSGMSSGYPTHLQHRAANCPWSPTSCGWNNYNSGDPNVHTLNGALVGGPTQGDGTAEDIRSLYTSNEPAMDYNAGYSGALAALVSWGKS